MIYESETTKEAIQKALKMDTLTATTKLDLNASKNDSYTTIVYQFRQGQCADFSVKSQISKNIG